MSQKGFNSSNKAGTFVDVVLGEGLHGTFDRNLLHASISAELDFARGGVFGQNIPEPQVVRVDVSALQILLRDL